MKNNRYDLFDRQVQLLSTLQSESMKHRKKELKVGSMLWNVAEDRERALQGIINTLRFFKQLHEKMELFYQLWSTPLIEPYVGRWEDVCSGPNEAESKPDAPEVTK